MSRMALRRVAWDGGVRGGVLRVEQGFLLVLGVAGAGGAGRALDPSEVAADVEEDRVLRRVPMQMVTTYTTGNRMFAEC